MSKLSALDISSYRARLAEYQVLYRKVNLGMQNGHVAYAKLVQDVAHLAAYIRMLEDMKPELLKHKPKNYTAHYRSVNNK